MDWKPVIGDESSRVHSRPLHAAGWGAEVTMVNKPGSSLLEWLEHPDQSGVIRDLCAGNGAVGLRLNEESVAPSHSLVSWSKAASETLSLAGARRQ
jgi:hypothetical protein